MFKRISAVIVLAVCVVSPAAAQEKSASERSVTSSFEELTRKLHKGQRVYVQDEDGRETEGRLARLSDQTITVNVLGSDREFAKENVRRVTRHGDPISNGAVIGAGIFAAWALAAMANGGCASDFGVGPCAMLVGTMAGIGAGIGSLVDYSMKGRTVVYRAPGTKALIAPAITPHRAGVAVTVRF